MQDFKQWLLDNKLDKYESVLLENAISELDILFELTESDLKELGFSLGDRKRFLKGLKESESNEQSSSISPEEQELLDRLPYVIAYPLKVSLEETHAWTKINWLKETFSNYLKYLCLLSASEFFNSEIRNRNIVDSFQKNLAKPSLGSWNAFTREVLKFLKEEDYEFFNPELVAYYELVESGKKTKKYQIEEEFVDDYGENQVIKKPMTGIGSLIYFRNHFIGHSPTLGSEEYIALWQEYYPIFKDLLVKMTFTSQYPMYKLENGEVYKMQGVVPSQIDKQKASKSNVWIENTAKEQFEILPFYIVPAELNIDSEGKEKMMSYESFTGKRLTFFSPEGSQRTTSGQVLNDLKRLLRDKQKEKTYSPEEYTLKLLDDHFVEINNAVLSSLHQERKVIPGIYQSRNDIELSLRTWIGAKASIFFVAAEAGSGKTNLLAEVLRQYTEMGIRAILLRAARMEKDSLEEEIVYLLNFEEVLSLKNYPILSGTQNEPTIILLDGLNETHDPKKIWKEIKSIVQYYPSGSLKFIVSFRSNSSEDINALGIEEKELELLYSSKSIDSDRLKLSSYVHPLSAMNMEEMKGTWDLYSNLLKGGFKPSFSFEDLSAFDRAIYGQINNPLVLRIFMEVFHGKQLPKKGLKHLDIWGNWFKVFNDKEQQFLRDLSIAVWEKGENELLLDDLLDDDRFKEILTQDNVGGPYRRLITQGWISQYSKDFTVYLSFTVEAMLVYLMSEYLNSQDNVTSVNDISDIFDEGKRIRVAGVEAYLLAKSLEGDLAQVCNLIDKEEKYIDHTISALVMHIKVKGVQATIDAILYEPTDNDWKAIKDLAKELNSLLLIEEREELLKLLLPTYDTNNEDSLYLLLKTFLILDDIDFNTYHSKFNFENIESYENEKLLFLIGDINKKKANYSEALEHYQKCLAIRKKVYGQEHPDVATSYNNIGMVYDNQGKYSEALEYYKKSLAIDEKVYGQEHPDVATSYNNIGLVYISQGKYSEALEYYQKCLAIDEKVYGQEHPDVATSYNNIGLVYKSQGKYSEALEYYKKCLAIKEKVYGQEHPDVATSYNNIGLVYKSQGKYSEALEYYKKSLAIRKKFYGQEHPDVATSYNNIGMVYYSQGKYSEALEYYKKCLAIDEKVYDQEHPDVATSYNNIGMVYDNQGKNSEALEYYKKSLAIRKKFYGQEHPSIATSYNNIGLVYKSQGKYSEALEYYQKCLAIEEKVYGQEHPDVAISYFNIGSIYESQENYSEAIDYFNNAINIKQYGGIYFQLGYCYEKQNELTNALECFEESARIRLEEKNENYKESLKNVERLKKKLNM